MSKPQYILGRTEISPCRTKAWTVYRTDTGSWTRLYKRAQRLEFKPTVKEYSNFAIYAIIISEHIELVRDEPTAKENKDVNED